MRNSSAPLSLRKSIFVALLFSLTILCGVPQQVSGHSGDNEAFSENASSSGPKEVSVDEQGIRALEIKTVKVQQQSIKKSLTATGEVQADETRAFTVNPPVTGVVNAVLAKQGDIVTAGQVLAIVQSVEVASNLTQLLNERTKITAEIARVKTKYSGELTLQNNQVQLNKSAFEREDGLLKEGISARKNYLEAKNAYDSALVRLATLKQQLAQEVSLLEKQLAVTIHNAKGQLRIMGIAESAVDDALRTGEVTSALSIKAPVAGCVIKREITLGERVDPSKSIFSIVNLSPIWAMVDIYQEQIPKVKEGQPVLLATPSNERISGRISSVGSVVDNETKTLHVRVIADNPRGILRPGMFVTAEILLGSSTKTALLVPESAIVTYKDRPYVYMHHIDEGHFEPSAIGVGTKAGGLVEVTSGLHEGELVVVSGASQLLAQSVLKPEAEHQHEGEKHSDHHGHEEAEAHAASSRAQVVMGFALGLGAAFLIIVAWVLIAKPRKKSEGQ